MTDMTRAEVRALTKDAQNRAWRTALQQLGIDVLVALVLVAMPLLDAAQDWSDFQWNVILFSLVKTAVATAFAFVMRRYLDPSKVPTPLPPSPTP